MWPWRLHAHQLPYFTPFYPPRRLLLQLALPHPSIPCIFSAACELSSALGGAVPVAFRLSSDVAAFSSLTTLNYCAQLQLFLLRLLRELPLSSAHLRGRFLIPRSNKRKSKLVRGRNMTLYASVSIPIPLFPGRITGCLQGGYDKLS